MLIRAGGKPLIVAVEMVNYNRVLKEELNRAGAADEDNHRCQQCDGRRLHGFGTAFGKQDAAQVVLAMNGPSLEN
jgi:hypothetical protein